MKNKKICKCCLRKKFGKTNTNTNTNHIPTAQLGKSDSEEISTVDVVVVSNFLSNKRHSQTKTPQQTNRYNHNSKEQSNIQHPKQT